MNLSVATIELLDAVAAAAGTEGLHLIVLSRPRRKTDSDATRIAIRPVQLGNQLVYQAARRVGSQEFHENVDPGEVARKVETWAASDFDQLNVYTTEADLEFRRRKDGSESIRRSKSTHKPANRDHNRSRQYIIPEGTPCPFLIATGVMTDAGKVRSSKQKKFRQINRYLEIVNDIVPHLPDDRVVNVVDFGCGRSYLTFALHHYFTSVLKRTVRMVGLDLKQKVIADCQKLANELNCDGLTFQHGDIAQHESTEAIDLCVSLHACNTATDEALGQAVKWNCSVILAVPCCHHELSGQLENSAQAALLRHGIMRERYAALATDTLRARALDVLGYRTQVIEFIDTEHTPKNLMIKAVRRASGTEENASSEYWRFRESLGIESFHLEQLVNLSQS